MSTVKATYDGFVAFKGVPTLLHSGEEYEADHPLVKANPALFTEPPAPEPPAGPKAAEPAEPPAPVAPQRPARSGRATPPRGKAKDGDG